jgi:hypothetical protein
MALRLFCARSASPGSIVPLDNDDFVLLDAADGREMHYLSAALVDQQLLERRGQDPSRVL